MDKKSIVLNALKKHYLGVISTINSNNKPESALMGFGQTNSLELIFGTFNNSRKYKNLKLNHFVSFVIGWDKKITIQYEGIATELTGGNRDRYKKRYFEKNPKAKPFDQYKQQRYFKVIPKWIRYSDLNQESSEVFELEF